MNFKSEPCVKTPLLNVDVVSQKLHFASELDFMSAHFVQRNAEQFTQAQKDVLSPLRIFVNQRDRRLQGVEKEMRMELRPQVLHLSFGKLRSELGSAELAFSILIVNAIEVRCAKKEPIRQKANLHVLSKVMCQHRGKRSVFAVTQPCDRCFRGKLNCRQEYADQKVQRNRALPSAWLNGVAPGKPHGQRREDSPEVTRPAQIKN